MILYQKTRKRISILVVVLLFISQLQIGVTQSEDRVAKAAGSGYLYFGRYVQTKITNEGDIKYLKSLNLSESNVVELNGVRIKRKGDGFFKATPIKWKILSESGDYYTLLSEYVLSERAFGMGDFWDASPLREWLNGDFLKEAFNEDEQNDIVQDEVVTPKKNYPNNTPLDDIITNDKVYLLSLDEVTSSEYGFGSDKDELDKSRIAYTTEYANKSTPAFNWWLRGNGYYSYGNMRTQLVRAEGDVRDSFETAGSGVRPVIRVKKDSKYILNNYVDDNRPLAPEETSTPTPTPTTAPTNAPTSTLTPSKAPSASSVPSSKPTTTPTSTSAPSSSPSPASKLDYWGFWNWTEYFGNEGYYISKNDYNRLIKNLSNTDRDRLSKRTENGIKYYYNVDGKEKLYEKWIGSCYGMSVTTCLVNRHILSAGDLHAGNTLFSATSEKNTISSINYYMWQQLFRKSQNATHSFSHLTQDEQLQRLESLAHENTDGTRLILLTFFWFDLDENGVGKGHAVVAYGSEKGSWTSDSVAGLPSGKTYSNRILIYDCSAGIGDSCDLYYNASGEFCIPFWKIQSNNNKREFDPRNNGFLGLATNQDWILNDVDYKTGERSSASEGEYQDSDYTLLESEDGSYHIRSAGGEADIDGTIVSNSSYKDSIIVTNDLCDGDTESPKRTYAFVPKDFSYEITSKDKDLSFKTILNDSSYTVSSASSGKVTLDKAGEISLTTDSNSTSSLSVCTDDAKGVINGCDTLFVSAGGTKSVSLNRQDKGVVVEGDNLKSLKIAGYEDAKTIMDTKVKTDKGAVFISGTKEKVTVAVDSNNDGKFDKIIATARKSTTEPTKVKLTKTKRTVKGKKVTLSLAWKKVSGASGYQIQVSGTKGFKSLSRYTTEKQKIKIKRKNNGKNYIRVRAFVKTGKKKLFGKWSKIKAL